MADSFNNKYSKPEGDCGNNNLFDQYGLKVATGEVTVGNTYPIYGMITKILSEEPGNVIVEINFNIIAKMMIPDPEKIETLKTRAFEPGIFVSTVVENIDKITVNCGTVIFGKRAQFND